MSINENKTDKTSVFHKKSHCLQKYKSSVIGSFLKHRI